MTPEGYDRLRDDQATGHLRAAHAVIIADAIFECYRFNREHSPELKPEDYAPVFPSYQSLERRYQAELTKANIEDYHKCAANYGG